MSQAIAVGVFGLSITMFALTSDRPWGNADSGEIYEPRWYHRLFGVALGLAMIAVAVYMRVHHS